jgi:hypothetical protein
MGRFSLPCEGNFIQWASPRRPPSAVGDADLAGLVTAWPDLPEAIRRGILAMVDAATG